VEEAARKHAGEARTQAGEARKRAEEARERAEAARKRAEEARKRAEEAWERVAAGTMTPAGPSEAHGTPMVKLAPGAATVSTRRLGVLVAASAVLVAGSIGALALQLVRDRTPPGDRVPPGVGSTASPGPTVAGRIVIRVPSVVGMSAFEARQEFLESGLELGEAIPVPGEPGIVVRTAPAQGSSVPHGSEIRVFVGTAPTRS
jgi:hypothetical protein